MSDNVNNKQMINDKEQEIESEDRKIERPGDQKVSDKKKLFSKKCRHCEKKEQEASEYKAGWQRAHADYQNLVKEMDNKKHEWLDWSKQQIIEDFLPVYDNFKKAFDNERRIMSNEQDNWALGIKYIMKQFEDVLKSHGVEEIKTVGEQFNPELHEAVAQEESERPEGTILRETEVGYRMNGKVIKAAKVIVAKKN